MEKKQAILLANLFDSYSKSISIKFEINKLETRGDRLHHFHQWTNGKPVVAGYNITKIGEMNYYFLFIDWHRNDNYYLVIYMGNKSTTLAEIQHTSEENGNTFLHWKYNPLKRDGKNLQRKAYFKQIFGSTSVYISLPKSPMEVEELIEQLFQLCVNRIKADRIADVFSIKE